MFEHMKLSEELKNHLCKCENCGFYPLKHFEECPKCNSSSYHLTCLTYIGEDTNINLDKEVYEHKNTKDDEFISFLGDESLDNKEDVNTIEKGGND
jgi:hypothetical protein